MEQIMPPPLNLQNLNGNDDTTAVAMMGNFNQLQNLNGDEEWAAAGGFNQLQNLNGDEEWAAAGGFNQLQNLNRGNDEMDAAANGFNQLQNLNRGNDEMDAAANGFNQLQNLNRGNDEMNIAAMGGLQQLSTTGVFRVAEDAMLFLKGMLNEMAKSNHFDHIEGCIAMEGPIQDKMSQAINSFMLKTPQGIINGIMIMGSVI